MRKILGLAAALGCTLSAGAMAQTPVGVDGTIGAEWAGVTPITIPVGPDVGYFGAYTGESQTVPYDIYARSDANYAYFAVEALGTGEPVFSNLYFGVGADAQQSSDLGIEITNNDVFTPGGSGSVSDLGTGIVYAVGTDGTTGYTTIELAIPFSYLMTDPQNIGFDTIDAADPNVELRISQSFGYSAVGGASFGPTRLGVATAPAGTTNAAPVPEPASGALLGIGVLGLLFGRARRRR